jgi:hypothetical protein
MAKKGRSRSRKMRGGKIEQVEVTKLRGSLEKRYKPPAVDAGIAKVLANDKLGTFDNKTDGFSRARAISNVAEKEAQRVAEEEAKRIANAEAAEAKRIANAEAAERAHLNALHEGALVKEAREEENMLSEIAQKENINTKLSAAAPYFKGSSKNPISPYQTPEEPPSSFLGSIGRAFGSVGTAVSSAVSGVASRVTPRTTGGKRTHKKRKHHKKRHSKKSQTIKRLHCRM